jgi:hypothetical protein
VLRAQSHFCVTEYCVNELITIFETSDPAVTVEENDFDVVHRRAAHITVKQRA